jgi:curved DNA-binding protein CbpA
LLKKKNYYEILGVAPHVGSGQIQAAYRFARSLYAGESSPTYGFLDGDERAQMLALVEEAYGLLSNPNARRDYDLQLASPGPATHRAPEVEPARSPVRTVDEPAPPAERQRHHETPSPAPNQVAGVDVLKVPEVVSGGVLRSLRETRGLSLDQIAALSKVGSRFLKALEEDRHHILPGRVFARGFLIEYARAIRVSEPELVERYLKHWNPK